jgi:hypothetical protein
MLALLYLRNVATASNSHTQPIRQSSFNTHISAAGVERANGSIQRREIDIGRKPLFPGDDYIKQMNLIFNVLGTPEPALSSLLRVRGDAVGI